MRVRNTHGAHCDGLEAGAEGVVDEKNPGVQIHLRAGLLVEIPSPVVEVPPPAGDAAPASGESEAPVEAPAEGKRAKRTG